MQATADAGVTTQRLGFGDVLAAGWRHYSRNFLPIALISLCVQVPISAGWALTTSPGATGTEGGSLWASLAPGLVALLGGLVAIIGVLAVARVVEDSVLGSVVSARQALWHGLKRWPAALGSFILLWLFLMAILVPMSILSVLAFLALGMLFGAAMGSDMAVVGMLLAMGGYFIVVAAIFVTAVAITVYLGFYPYASSLRQQGPLAALRYSVHTVRGHALRVLTYQFGIGLFSGFVSFCILALVLAAGIMAGMAPELAAPARIIIFSVQLIGSIIGALFTVMLAVFFLNLDYLRHPPA